MVVLMAEAAHVKVGEGAKKKHYYTYFIRESGDPLYLPGRCADVYLLVDGAEKKSTSMNDEKDGEGGEREREKWMSGCVYLSQIFLI